MTTLSKRRAGHYAQNQAEDAAWPADTAVLIAADRQNDLDLAQPEKDEKEKTKASLKEKTEAKHPGVNATSQGMTGMTAGTILEGSPQPKRSTLDLKTSEC